MQELVSIIIPCFNAQSSISRTLMSVLEQDYKNLEIIVVNDGSNDNSLKVIKCFMNFDKRIKVINQQNSGVSVARNNGLSQSKGDYIVFLDADDNYTTPYSISKMMKTLLENNADMCICDFTHPCFEKHIKGNRIFDLNNNNDFLEFYQDFFLFGMPWNKITKRSCLTEKFVEGIKFNEDELFNIDNLKNIKKVVLLDEVLHNYHCANYNPNMPASAVNSIYLEDKFWEKKSTIWHIGMKNHKYRVESINKYFPNKIDEMQFVRSFDFLFWDFFLMAKNRVKKEYIFEAIKSIFQTDLFKKSLKAKEMYGINLKELNNLKIEKFVNCAYYAFIDIKSCNKKLLMTKVFCGLFAYFFYDSTKKTNSVDILVKTMFEVKEKSSAEGLYVNKIINFHEKHNNADMIGENILNWQNFII